MRWEAVDSLETYTARVKTFRREHRGMLTNCYLMPDELREAIREGKLSMFLAQDCLYVALDRPDYQAVYYMVDPEIRAFQALPQRDKPWVLNLPRKQEDCPREMKEDEGLRAAGFRFVTVHQRMQRRLSEDDEPGQAQADAVRATQNLTDDIIALWRGAIDPLSTVMPCAEEQLPPTAEILRIVDAEGVLAAAGKVTYAGQAALVEHLCTRPDQRGRGYAGRLLQAMAARARAKEARILRLWVDTQNEPAIRLYRKTGFEPDGMVSSQYMMP